MRSFTSASLLDGSGLSLALAPGLTPAGLSESPEFFSGFAVAPTVLARGLLVLADVARTRYFQPVPAGGGGSDPICTANGDRLRFEAFSACNTVAVRLDLLAGAFDGGDIRHGTTNVDINQPLREALGGVSPAEPMHLSVGDGGLRVSTPEATHVERRVELPERWLRALGPAQELSRDLTLIGQAPAVQTRQLLASLASAPGGLGHWSISRRGVRPALRPGRGTVYAENLGRLRAARRLGQQITGLRVYGAGDGAEAASVWELDLPHGRLTFTLTAEYHRSFSGEGALLPTLSARTAVEDAETVVGLVPLAGPGRGGDGPAAPIALATAQGVVKRVKVGDEPRNGDAWEVISLAEGDEVVWASTAADTDVIVLVASDAQLLRFQAARVRPQGRGAGGMAGISLHEGARVVAAGRVPADLEDLRVVEVPLGPHPGTAAREAAQARAARELAARAEADHPDLVYERYSLFSRALSQVTATTGAASVLEVNSPLVDEQRTHRGLCDAEGALEVLHAQVGAAGLTLCVSGPVEAWVRGHCPTGRVRTLPNGVNTVRITPRPEDPDQVVVTFVGTLKPWHGVEDLLRAAALAREPWSLRVVGDGPQGPALRSQAREDGLEVDFRGAVAPEQVPDHLAGSAVAVAPYPEPTTGQGHYFSPLKVYEYMAAGLPVVASAVGQLPGALEGCGLLVPPSDPQALADALDALASDPRRRRELGRRARQEAVDHHSWSRVVTRALELAGVDSA